ncbi:SpaA isopeptide-forming pilin-related protein [Enterococcus sp. CSURQ0835]|uniref:SpaA isopeptide-forming pilin-related protein n=1 Tax=Enterococcus sp. CSURQ0835 TaxID=2681394 RepID=UPI00135A1F0F|nr:prealbumin-like fold domain-containing protein [Enterococcus sp. CSURQ0835]
MIKTSKQMKKTILSVAALSALGFGALSLGSSDANAAKDDDFKSKATLKMKPGETGTIYFNEAGKHHFVGTKSGAPWQAYSAQMAFRPDGTNGEADMITFCADPTVSAPGATNPGYQAVDANDIPRNVQLASCLWRTHFIFGATPTEFQRMATQAYIWEGLPFGITVDTLEGQPFAPLRDQINRGLAEYDKTPNLDKQTIEIPKDQNTELKSDMDLHAFETLHQNSANLDYLISPDGYTLTIKPKSDSPGQGTLTFKRGYANGSPIALEKPNSQRVWVPSIKDPAMWGFNVHIKGETPPPDPEPDPDTGDIKIKKVDAETNKAVPGTEFDIQFTGKGSPTDRKAKTDDKGEINIKDVEAGVKVKATEINVPEPYVLAGSKIE